MRRTRHRLRQIVKTGTQGDPRFSKFLQQDLDFFVVRPAAAILSLAIIGSRLSRWLGLAIIVILPLVLSPILFAFGLLLAVFRAAGLLIRLAIKIGDILTDMLFPR